MGRKPCCVKGEVKKGPWSAEEDEKLTNFILNNGGHRCWRALPILAGLNRCGKSCRLRWTNYLRPDIKLGCFTDTEEQLVIDLHALHGNSWSKIAAMLPGRTDNEIKNRWNVDIKKKLIKKGIDPSTHKPLQENEETGGQIEALSRLGASPEINVDQSPKSPENFKTEEAQSPENSKNDETQPPEPRAATAATDEDYQKLLMSYWAQSKFLGDDFMPPAGLEYSNEFGPSSSGNDFGREEDSGYISFNDLWTY